ncbi:MULTISPECIES: hypothetical protein [unclassified Leptospira]|uniref:hypothetical protein n=1 Tax=unclassified Leptospira TaxID=2633828 RepID=UPI0002BD5504|nr:MULTISPECIES: hypothetical protein [unclassified Leptospira]EMK00907.1 hypothetical protein LEP1GSC192_1823 [Leptospira sp. B5-022]MCR1795902.1 hypothetical protein [Leptospira sp. id769339]
MKKLIIVQLLILAFSAHSKLGLYADGCYICSSGSSSNCRDYCSYSGSDTSENRKKCEKSGCKIGGTASCPTAVNYKVCSASIFDPPIDKKSYLASLLAK